MHGEFAEQTCCGQMFTNTGYYDEAVPDVRNTEGVRRLRLHRRSIRLCIGAVRHHPMLAAHSVTGSWLMR